MVITSEEIFSLIDSANERFNNRDFVSSIEYINKVNEMLNNQIDEDLDQLSRIELAASLQNLLGFCQIGLMNFEKAVACFSKGLEYSYDNKQSKVGLAEVAYLNDDLEKVESLVNSYGNSRSHDNSVSRNLANMAQSIINKIESELKIIKKNTQIQILLDQNENQKAELQMKELVDDLPYNIDVQNNYASILILNEKYEKAINALDTVLCIDPQNETALASMNYIEKEIERKKLYPSEKFLDLFIHFSNRCNYKCIFCSLKDSQGKGQIVSLNDFIGIEAFSGRARMVDITGFGEITIHPEFEAIINYFSEKNVEIRFVTNGFNLSERVCKIIEESTVSEIVISINSLNKETYKKMMGVDGLERVLNNIERLTKVYKKRLQFSFVISSYNFNEIKDFIDLGKKYNTHIACLGLTPTYDYEEEIQLEINDGVREKINEYRNYAHEQNVSFFIFNIDNQKGTESRTKNLTEVIKRCDWVYTKMFVGADGSVGPCCWSKVKLGNVFEQTFEEIWEGKKYTDLRNLIKEGNPKHCSNCRREG